MNETQMHRSHPVSFTSLLTDWVATRVVVAEVRSEMQVQCLELSDH